MNFPVDTTIVKKIISKEVARQIPNADNVFKIMGFLITVIGMLSAGMLTLVITSLRIKP